jgi:DNA-binding transcriptional LysR family regulator
MAFAATELMPGAVSRFRLANPHVEVKLQYIRTQGQKIALANDEIDIGYMIGPFDHSEYHAITLAREPLYVVTPKNHPFLRKPTIEPGDLAGAALILGDMREWGEYRWRLNDMFSGEGIALDVALEASNTLALIGLVAAGLGVTIYPESLIGFLGRNVEVRPIRHPAFASETVLVWKRTNRDLQVRSFVDIARRLPVRR